MRKHRGQKTCGRPPAELEIAWNQPQAAQKFRKFLILLRKFSPSQLSKTRLPSYELLESLMETFTSHSSDKTFHKPSSDIPRQNHDAQYTASICYFVITDFPLSPSLDCEDRYCVSDFLYGHILGYIRSLMIYVFKRFNQ